MKQRTLNERRALQEGLRVRQYRARRMALSPRQYMTLELVARGLKHNQIGAIMGISPKTVDSHMQAIYHKFKIRGGNASAAVFVARQEGILSK